MKPIIYSKKIVSILLWYGLLVLTGTACFKSIEKKYWTNNSTISPIAQKTNGIAQKSSSANDIPANAIEKKHSIDSDYKMVDQSGEGKNGVGQCANDSCHKEQRSNLLPTNDRIEVSLADDAAWAQQVEEQIRQDSQSQILQDRQTQQDQEEEAFMQHYWTEEQYPQKKPSEKSIPEAYSEQEEEACSICCETLSTTKTKMPLKCCAYKQYVCSDCFSKVNICPYCKDQYKCICNKIFSTRDDIKILLKCCNDKEYVCSDCFSTLDKCPYCKSKKGWE